MWVQVRSVKKMKPFWVQEHHWLVFKPRAGEDRDLGKTMEDTGYAEKKKGGIVGSMALVDDTMTVGTDSPSPMMVSGEEKLKRS